MDAASARRLGPADVLGLALTGGVLLLLLAPGARRLSARSDRAACAENLRAIGAAAIGYLTSPVGPASREGFLPHVGALDAPDRPAQVGDALAMLVRTGDLEDPKRLVCPTSTDLALKLICYYHNAIGKPEKKKVIARKKAIAGSRLHKDQFVLGADTVVVHHKQVLHKCRGEHEARLRLAQLSDDAHIVVTGLALARNGKAVDSTAETTQVRFARLPRDVVDAYIESEAWVGKAGGYGIQDAALAPFITIDGNWSNVVGLPLGATVKLLRRNDITCKDAPDESWLRDHNPFLS